MLNIKLIEYNIQFEKVRKKVEQLGDKVEDQKCQVAKQIFGRKNLEICQRFKLKV